MSRKSMTETQKEKNRQVRNTETKEERFVRIAKPRLQKALKHLQLLQAMVSSKQYEVSEESYNRIISILEDEIIRFNASYKSRQTKNKEAIEVNL